MPAPQYSRNWPNRIPIWLLRIILNLWPPFLAAGIKVKKISTDYLYIQVMMKLRWYNTNWVGTHFGGSMYAMTDPFYMLMLIKNLGSEYIVWDKAAHIDFKKPGRGTLKATFRFLKEDIQAIREKADQNEKFIFDKPVDIVNEEGVVVATVLKTLYVKRKDKNISEKGYSS